MSDVQNCLRSGSSYTADLFSSIKKSSYFFEPLLYLRKSYNNFNLKSNCFLKDDTISFFFN